MEAHEYANIFPMMNDTEFHELCQDMAENGYRPENPIITYHGKILDGRNRFKASEEVGVLPMFVEYGGDDPLNFVLSQNLHRRHLNSSQRAIVALEIEKALSEKAKENMRIGGEGCQKIDTPIGRAAQEAARIVGGTNRQYISDAKRIQAEAPEMIPAIMAGETNIAKVMRGIRREEKVKDILSYKGRENEQLTTYRKFNVICADPPWRYDFSNTENREIENQYPTMSIEDICALAIPAADDCVLFLWATSPKLPEALRVINAWGFEYKTNMVWVKDKIGMGYYARQQHELILIATKGNLPTPLPEDRPSSIINAQRTIHSTKPQELYDLILKMYPQYGKPLEMFAREKREGWFVWGNEV